MAHWVCFGIKEGGEKEMKIHEIEEENRMKIHGIYTHSFLVGLILGLSFIPFIFGDGYSLSWMLILGMIGTGVIMLTNYE